MVLLFQHFPMQMLCNLKNAILSLVGKIANLFKRNGVEYTYHIIIPKNKALKVNDCFGKICKTRAKPFVLQFASKGVSRQTHVGALSLSEDELKIFEIIFKLDDSSIFWWKIEKETNKLDECNDADCVIYVGEVLDPKLLFKKAGFILLSQE